MTLERCETQQLGKEENMTVVLAGILVPSCELGATERGRISEQTLRGLSLSVQNRDFPSPSCKYKAKGLQNKLHKTVGADGHYYPSFGISPPSCWIGGRRDQMVGRCCPCAVL